MIKDIQFKNSDGFLRATIDNQSLSLSLKEIIKGNIRIYNNAVTSIPLHSSVPIDFSIYTINNVVDELESIINDLGYYKICVVNEIPDIYDTQEIYLIPLEDNDHVIYSIFMYIQDDFHKIGTFTTSHNTYSQEVDENINEDTFFTSTKLLIYNKLNSLIKEHYHLMDKGEVSISIFQTNKTNLYYQDVFFTNGRYNDNINLDLPLGQYFVKIEVKETKYYNSGTLTYKLVVEPRKALYIFENDTYYGNPLEEVNINVKICDSINYKPLNNYLIYYTYQDMTFLSKTDENGNLSMNVVVPDVNANCSVQNVYKYPINFYIINEEYYLSEGVVYLYSNKLPTEISINSITNYNTIDIDGIVLSNNYNSIEPALYGKVKLIIDDIEYANANLVEHGAFLLSFNSELIESGYANQEKYDIYYFNKEKRIDINLSEIPHNNSKGKINIQANITHNDKPVIYGMVSFSLKKGNKTLEKHIFELDDNGEAYTQFYVSSTGEYNILCKYHNIFEYSGEEKNINFMVE